QLPGTQSWVQITDQLRTSQAALGVDLATLPQATGIFNLVACIAIALVSILLVLGVKESARFNNAAVAIKLFVVMAFILAGGYFLLRNPAIASENWSPFIAENTGTWGVYGWSGVMRASGVIFFAYIGFDAVSTAAEEARDPQRDMPRAMMWSLGVTSVIYIVVTLVLTGLVPWTQHGTADPLAQAFTERGYDWAAGVISFGAVVAMASVLLVFQMGQPRIFYSMARDGLLPKWAARVHPRYLTPVTTTILTGVFVAFFSAFANINEVIELTNIGTLFAFVLVAIGVMVLRIREPERHRPFRTPAIWFVAPAAVVSCTYLMLQLPWITWERFIIWLVAGLVIYLVYGYRRSRLGRGEPAPETELPAAH
ncbi:MAG TPA: amino acid permease, partial [Longimicrobiaceae bacterium]